MADNSSVAHEGNPKQDTLTITGGNVLTTATLGIVLPFEEPPVIVPVDTPPPPGGGGSCEGLQPVQLNQNAIDACASASGDGVVTGPGDYTGDPTYYQELCENYYGDWRFGLNATNEGDFPQPGYYVTPGLWLPAKGQIFLDSTCPARVTRFLQFDYRGNAAATPRDVYAVTPSTFQSAYIDANRNNGIVGGAAFNCQSGSFHGSGYWSHMEATFVAALNTGIAGIGMITTNGNGNLTGYGLLIDKVNNIAAFVRWDDSSQDGFTLLNSTPYIPVNGDVLVIEPRMECPCPFDSLTSPIYPMSGRIEATIIRSGDLWNVSTDLASLPPAEFQALEYGCLLALTVNNGTDLNLIGFRNVTVYWQSAFTNCP